MSSVCAVSSLCAETRTLVFFLYLILQKWGLSTTQLLRAPHLWSEAIWKFFFQNFSSFLKCSWQKFLTKIQLRSFVVLVLSRNWPQDHVWKVATNLVGENDWKLKLLLQPTTFGYGNIFPKVTDLSLNKLETQMTPSNPTFECWP